MKTDQTNAMYMVTSKILRSKCHCQIMEMSEFESPEFEKVKLVS